VFWAAEPNTAIVFTLCISQSDAIASILFDSTSIISNQI
jgi:hypothetical protein